MKKGFISILLVVLTLILSCSFMASAKTSDIIYGDANGDGQLSIADATHLQKYLAGLVVISDETLTLAKVMNKDTLTIADVTAIQKKLAGIIDRFPIEETDSENTNILVAYFSRTGNTAPLAKNAAEYLNADLFEIEASVPYTDEDIAYYTNCRADREQSDPTARPQIANKVENMDRYDTVVLAYPIWHGQAPRIISTFLESYDFADKTIIPFCTSQSSGIGNSDTNLHSLVSSDAIWKKGKRFAPGTQKEEIVKWLDESGIQPFTFD